MKKLIKIGTATLLFSLMGSQSVNAAGWEATVTKDACVVNGVENIRTPRYKKTPETEEIMDLERLACEYLANNEFDKLGKELLHTHGIILLDSGRILYGADEQVSMFKQYIEKGGLYLTYEPAEAHVSASKDMAWAMGLVKIQFPGQGLEVQKYLSIWEKEDGKWKNVAEMRNPNKP